MSNSDDSTDNQQEQMEYYCIPRKFVFDVPDDNSNSQKEDPKKRALKKSLEAEKYMPFIFSFPEPANYKDSYTLLIKQLLGVYNHIRLLIVEEYYEELKHIIKDIKIEQPGDCLNMLKELLTGCCEKIQTRTNDGSEANGSDSVKDYEELLQKAEAKIRVLIRNEQIFRLNFDILSQKCEDADKSIQAVNQELEASKKIRETMTKENLELVSKLKVKDEEIRKAHKERDVVEKKLKEAADNLAAIDNLDQAGGDPKNLTQSWNQQLLNMLVKEKFTPSETSSRPPSNFDAKGFGGIRQSSSRLTPTDRAKGDKKSNVSGNANLLSTSSGNLNKMQVDRLKSSLIADFKKHMNANLSLGTNRAVLNASLDVMLNKSTEQSHSQERNSVSGAMLSAKKRNSQQIKMGQSQDQIRMKPPMREKKSVESNEREVASYIANKSSTLQKIITTGNKQGTSSTRPTSTGKSRGSPLVSKSRVVQTEQSPDNKSQESRILYTYASNQSTDMVTGAYSGNPKKKSAEPRDSKNQVKGSAKSSLLIKNMIAEQLSKKLGNKAV